MVTIVLSASSTLASDVASALPNVGEPAIGGGMVRNRVGHLRVHPSGIGPI